MVNLASPSYSLNWVASQIKTSHGVWQKNSSQLPPTPSSSSSSSSHNTRITPAVLIIIVILAIIFLVSGLLHFLVKLLIKKKDPSSSPSHSNHTNQELTNSEALQRQLRQLFHLHDSGLDQAFIDALPVFLYREIVGSKEPFDCAVCLCEFLQDDELRLLPVCGHAFHLDCIDTWLLSSSTCPLCRGALFVQGDAVENPMFDFEEEMRLEEGRLEPEEIGCEKRVVHVRLGKFRSTSNRDHGDDVGAVSANLSGSSVIRREEGETSTSSSNLDARRCYSMGSYEYVVGDANLRVALAVGDRFQAQARVLANEEGKRLGARSKGDSFSVSKIWLWGNNKKGKFPVSSSDASSLDAGLPWMMARKSEGNT